MCHSQISVYKRFFLFISAGGPNGGDVSFNPNVDSSNDVPKTPGSAVNAVTDYTVRGDTNTNSLPISKSFDGSQDKSNNNFPPVNGITPGQPISNRVPNNNQSRVTKPPNDDTTRYAYSNGPTAGSAVGETDANGGSNTYPNGAPAGSVSEQTNPNGGPAGSVSGQTNPNGGPSGSVSGQNKSKWRTSW